MSILKGLAFAGRVLTLALFVSLFLSTATFADPPRGRDRDKKSDKFNNGHDARDGRFDGRGPRGYRVKNDWRDNDDNDRWDRRRGRWMDRDDRWDRKRNRWMDRHDRWDRKRNRWMDRDDRWDRKRDRRDKRDDRDWSRRYFRR